MKKILSAVAATVMLAACSEKSLNYTINGSFNVPESFPVGDTVITRGPIEGYVYLVSLQGEPFDSVQIVDEKFTFTGLMDKGGEPYFAYIASQYGQGMFVIEPGEMEAVLGEPTIVSGTATNDQITSMMAYVDTIGYQLYAEMQAWSEAHPSDSLDSNTLMLIYSKYSGVVNNYIDSMYHANSENLMGVYCANVMSIQAQSSAELETIIEHYSDYVKNSELIQEHLKYLREVEASAELEGEIDPE